MTQANARLMWLSVFVVLLVLAAGACAPTAVGTTGAPRFDAPYDGPRETVALILDTRYGWTAWGRDTHRAMADAALYELVNHPYGARRFVVVERSRVDRILEEMRFVRTGVVDPQTAAQAGRLLGARSIVIMTVTGVTVSPYRLTVARVGGSAYDVRATLQMRLVDVETGAITAVERAELQQVVGSSFRVPGVSFSGRPQDAALLTAVNNGARSLIDDLMRSVASR